MFYREPAGFERLIYPLPSIYEDVELLDRGELIGSLMVAKPWVTKSSDKIQCKLHLLGMRIGALQRLFEIEAEFRDWCETHGYSYPCTSKEQWQDRYIRYSLRDNESVQFLDNHVYSFSMVDH